MRNTLFASSTPIASFFFGVGLLIACTQTSPAATYPYAPVHGVLLDAPQGNVAHSRTTLSAKLDAIAGLSAEQSGVFGVDGNIADPDLVGLHRHSGFSALYATASHRLRAVTLEPAYTAGLPDPHIHNALAVGDLVPDLEFVDQTGSILHLRDLRGKLVLLSFFYTRCPDREICPAISGRYAYLQSHADPYTTALLEISLDPNYDTPPMLAAYGRTFGAEASQWHLVTAQSHTISDALALFGLSNLQSHPGNFIHDDILAFIGQDGRLRQTITTVGWSPDDVLASIASLNGLPSDPIARIRLAAIANLVTACGGSTTAAVAIMDSVVFVAGVLILGSILYWFGRKIWGSTN